MDALELYFEIKRQREGTSAPVDTMGCASAPFCTTSEQRMLHILVSLLLSSQTRDETTYEAMEMLRRLLPEGICGSREHNGLTVENIVQASTEHINQCIRRVGFHNRKAVHLKRIAETLHDAGLPRTYEDTMVLPGIGAKMAILYMRHACNEVMGISVDTHVHRVSNRIGLAHTSSPLKTQQMLEQVVPRDEWGMVNGVLVGHGQTICTAKSRRCSECCVRHRCPSSLF